MIILDYSRHSRESGWKPHSFYILTEYRFSPIRWMKKEHPFVVKLRCRILKNNPKEPFMSIVNTLALEDSVISLFIYFPQQIQKTGTPSCTNRFPAKNHTFRLGYRLRKHQIQLKFCHSLIRLFFPEPKVRPPWRNPSLRPGQMCKKKPDHRPCHYTVQ